MSFKGVTPSPFSDQFKSTLFWGITGVVVVVKDRDEGRMRCLWRRGVGLAVGGKRFFYKV